RRHRARAAARARDGDRAGHVQADPAESRGVLHRPPAGRAAAAGHRRDRGGEPVDRGRRHDLSGAAGVAIAAGGGDARMTVLEARALSKSYIGGDGGTIKVLDAIDFRVARGEMVAIIGSSGAGKSTLLHLLGALDRPTAGQVLIDGASVNDLSDDGISALRNRTV